MARGGRKMVLLVLTAAMLGAILGANFTVGALIPGLLAVLAVVAATAVLGGEPSVSAIILLIAAIQAGFVAGAATTFLGVGARLRFGVGREFS
jgi:hypothetical protein